MTINYQELEKYVNLINSSHSAIKGGISIVRDQSLLPKAVGDSEIHISDNSITLLLLYSCFAKDCKLFRDVLFYFYWACANITRYKLQATVYCLKKMEEIILNRESDMYGIAQSIPLDVIVRYVIGHEAIHNCFYRDKNIKNLELDKSSRFLSEVNDDIMQTKNVVLKLLFKHLVKEMNDEHIISDEKEEYACDRLSLKFLYEHVLRKDLSEDDHKNLILQLMTATMMLQYDNNMTSLNEGVFNRRIYLAYISKHIRLGVLRVANVAYTLQDIYNYDIEIDKYIKTVNNQGQKIISGFSLFNIASIGYCLSDEMPSFDNLEYYKTLKNELDNVSNYLNHILFGEVV